jgi:hypothetical protein
MCFAFRLPSRGCTPLNRSLKTKNCAASAPRRPAVARKSSYVFALERRDRLGSRRSGQCGHELVNGGFARSLPGARCMHAHIILKARSLRASRQVDAAKTLSAQCLCLTHSRTFAHSGANAHSLLSPRGRAPTVASPAAGPKSTSSRIDTEPRRRLSPLAVLTGRSRTVRPGWATRAGGRSWINP